MKNPRSVIGAAQFAQLRPHSAFHPKSVPARWQAIAHRVNQLHHARVAMSEKTLKNHIANLKAALRHLSGDKTIPARGTPLTPEWSELRELVNHEMNRYHLTGLMRFASMQSISPKAVDDAILARYMSYRADVLVQDASPRQQRSIVRAWNGCVEDHAGWPQHKLTAAPLGGTLSLSWEPFLKLCALKSTTTSSLFKPFAGNPMEPAAAFPKPRRSKRALRKSRHLPGELCPSEFPLPH